VPRAPLPVTSTTRGRVASQRHLEERYPFFLARTSSCAKPASSSGLRVSTLISRGPGRLLRAPAGNWFFPTLSLPVFARMLEPLLPSGGRVHLPVTSPNLVGLPQLPRWVGFPNRPAKRLRAAGVARSSLFLTFRPRGLFATQVSPTAAQFLPAQGSRDFYPRAKPRTVTGSGLGMLAVRIRQLTAKGLPPF
jgi:hypothetical protein